MKKLYNCSIICTSVDEKIKVLLILLIKHQWRNGSKKVIGNIVKGDYDSVFNNNLVLSITSNGSIVQGSSASYEKLIDPFSIINETEDYLNELR